MFPGLTTKELREHVTKPEYTYLQPRLRLAMRTELKRREMLGDSYVPQLREVKQD